MNALLKKFGNFEVIIEFFFLYISPHNGLEPGEVGMNGIQRKCGSFTLGQKLDASEFISNAAVALAEATISIDTLKKGGAGPAITIESEDITTAFKEQYLNQVFNVKQQLAMEYNGSRLELTIDAFDHAAVGISEKASNLGQIILATTIVWKKNPNCATPIIITGAGGQTRNDSLFKKDFNFEKMGIGGLGQEFQTIFRRAFASRIFPGLVGQLGINHVRGMLLYGPPGCGKTLIARQIGKVLNAREPKIINGPEVSE